MRQPIPSVEQAAEPFRASRTISPQPTIALASGLVPLVRPQKTRRHWTKHQIEAQSAHSESPAHLRSSRYSSRTISCSRPPVGGLPRTIGRRDSGGRHKVVCATADYQALLLTHSAKERFYCLVVIRSCLHRNRMADFLLAAYYRKFSIQDASGWKWLLSSHCVLLNNMLFNLRGVAFRFASAFMFPYVKGALQESLPPS